MFVSDFKQIDQGILTITFCILHKCGSFDYVKFFSERYITLHFYPLFFFVLIYFPLFLSSIFPRNLENNLIVLVGTSFSAPNVDFLYAYFIPKEFGAGNLGIFISLVNSLGNIPSHSDVWYVSHFTWVGTRLANGSGQDTDC